MNVEDSKTAKPKNPLIYDSKYSFYKYRLTEFVNISSIESKFDWLEKFYEDFIDLMDVDADPENIGHKLAINDKLIKEYEKLYEREPKDNKNDT